MVSTGLDLKTLQKFGDIFSKYSNVQKVILYGSRAKGSHHPYSDIDLVVVGQGLDRFEIAAILMELEDTDIPYKMDLQNYHDLKNQQLIDHIDRVGVIVFEKEPSDFASL